MRCTGAGDQLCGGPNALSLYKNLAFTPPVIKPLIGKYASKQCLTDPLASGGRSLQGASTTSSTMTADVCVKFCMGKRFRYAGVEYGSECYCGSNIAPNTGKQGACVPANLMVCAGNPLQYCGGPGFMNLYYSAML